ncbi:Hpt domain-containing protein [Pontiellaceae bacterium B12219]|nr:Hpt domain-containing protein [Pontiellaceae bacterium B12219]
MANILGNTEWVADLVPELNARKIQFMVDTDEVDDELIEVFVDELKRLAGELQEGLKHSDADMVRMAAHSIKGMGGTIGLPEISVLGLEIELLARDNELLPIIPFVEALAAWIKTIG